MATNLSTCRPGDGIEALNRLPRLAEPLLQIDLDKELKQCRGWRMKVARVTCPRTAQTKGQVQRLERIVQSLEC